MVHDRETGSHVATIERGRVIDDITGGAIAKVRDGVLFALDGTPWHCHLAACRSGVDGREF